jgi:hypothetical protein
MDIENYKAYIKENSYREQTCKELVCDICECNHTIHCCTDEQCREHDYYGYSFNHWQKIKIEYKAMKKVIFDKFDLKAWQRPKHRDKYFELQFKLLDELYPKQ